MVEGFGSWEDLPPPMLGFLNNPVFFYEGVPNIPYTDYRNNSISNRIDHDHARTKGLVQNSEVKAILHFLNLSHSVGHSR